MIQNADAPLVEKPVTTDGETSEDIVFVPDIKERIKAALDERANSGPRNRAERRALRKKLGKKGRAEYDVIANTAAKLTYIDLIEKLRELNNKKENMDNEQATKD